MDTTVKERLIAYINYKGLSKHKFESICGLSSRYVSNISKSIQPAIVEKISLNFPDLNMGWVLTGYGNMLNEQPTKKRIHTGGIPQRGRFETIFRDDGDDPDPGRYHPPHGGWRRT